MDEQSLSHTTWDCKYHVVFGDSTGTYGVSWGNSNVGWHSKEVARSKTVI